MMHLLSWMSVETVRDLGWTLIHFLWQGLLLAALLELILPMVQGARARHNWALATLVMMALAPLITFLLIHEQESAIALQDASHTTVATGPDTILSGVHIPFTYFASTPVPTPWINWLVAVWFAGISILSTRALGGWYLAESLRRRDSFDLPAQLFERCQTIHKRLAITRPVQFLQSMTVSVPTVVGWIRPVVLLPISAIAGLSPQQLDALIMHELAHIQRSDAIINILQLFVETMLFYHPAIWLVSRRVRIERENCCDDMAVSRCGDAVVYVEALASLEASRFSRPLALAANGGKLRNRVARILDVPSDNPQRYSLTVIAGAAIVSLVVGGVAAATPSAVMTEAIVSAVPDLATRIAAIFPRPSPVASPTHAVITMIAPDPTAAARVPAEPLLPSTNKLVAIVDGAPISEYALQQRVQMVVALSANKPTDADMKRIRSDSLQLLEEEAVEREVAIKSHVTVSPSDINKQIDDLLSKRNMTLEQLKKSLADNGSSEATLRDQLVAATAWQRVAMLERDKSNNADSASTQVTDDAPEPMPSHGPILAASALLAPPYPQISRRLGEQGTTVLSLSVNRSGDVTDALVFKSSGKPRLDKAAVQWARANWHFLPAVKAGSAVEGSTTEKVHWYLTDVR